MANYDIGHGMMVNLFTESEMRTLEDSFEGHKNIFKSDAKPLYNGPQNLKWVKTRKAEAITQKELLLLLAWLLGQLKKCWRVLELLATGGGWPQR